MLATAWINYKNTASYFQLSLSSNGIIRSPELTQDPMGAEGGIPVKGRLATIESKESKSIDRHTTIE